jgi:large subunit ribosomal protein L33
LTYDPQSLQSAPHQVSTMPRDIIILECTEAKAEGKPTSRYVTTRNKKSLRTPGRLEKVKFNPFLKRRTLHREIR